MKLLKRIWIVIKKFFGWGPKVVPTPVNNFLEWNERERQVATFINMVREENKPLSISRKIAGLFYSKLNNIPDLTPEKLLWEEARKRCEAQFGRPTISHEGVGVAFKAIIDSGFESPAEILAYGYVSTSAVVNAWFNSESHKKIMLRNSYKYFGVANLKHNNKNYYCVLFCK